MTGAARVFFIAEAGVNHNGDVELAHQLIDIAADAGADAVKFQTFTAAALATAAAPTAAYQKRATADSQQDMLKKLELSRAAYPALVEHCRERRIEFMSSPFDEDALRFLVDDVGVQRLKLGSGELTCAPMIVAAARSGLPLILSTGMAALDEIDAAVGLFASTGPEGDAPERGADYAARGRAVVGDEALRARLSILQCTTEYPADAGDLNLRVIPALAARYGLDIGLSDHSVGVHLAAAAVALGARLIEKHFTLDRGLPGPDHQASLEPDELRRLIQDVRDVERALGDGDKRPVEAELKNRVVARKSVVAARDLPAGTVLARDDLGTKRPGSGVSPMQIAELIGRTTTKPLNADDQLRTEDLE